MKRLVIYTSEAELDKAAGDYVCLVNYNPFTKTGQLDDGRGHHADVTFVAMDPAVMDPASSIPTPLSEFDSVEFVAFPWPAPAGS
jgi:hypothetical protein